MIAAARRAVLAYTSADESMAADMDAAARRLTLAEVNEWTLR